ncbi:uncharacterized protein LOC118808815 isoform X2 [Colossoma macropomum]|nr:uncharacterized protein LOC118808815 isoform X2 [Colossoma macropomum]
MDKWYLLHLIQVLLITPCFCENNMLDCPDIKTTVGQPLNLTCTVMKCVNTGCKDCNSTKYKWKKDNKTLKHGNSTGQLQFYYPIQNASMEHNGTYTFWVQLKSGPLTKNFSVLLLDIPLNCPDIKTTVGQPLNLTCTVGCKDCNSTKYKWKKDNKTLKHGNSTGQLQFYYPIQNSSMEHNGTYTFWVQLKSGPLTKHFSVIISENKTGTNHHPNTRTGEYSHNHKVAVIFVAIPSTIALVASIGYVYKKMRSNCSFPNRERVQISDSRS